MEVCRSVYNVAFEKLRLTKKICPALAKKVFQKKKQTEVTFMIKHTRLIPRSTFSSSSKNIHI